MEINNKTVIVVTGATRGFGRALVENFADHGAIVYGTYNSSKVLADELERKYSNLHLFQVSNTEAAEIKDFIQTILKQEGHVDILINNAGSINERKKIVDLSLANWQNLIDVHLTGAFLYCQNVLPTMQSQNSGLILNIASRMGFFENAKAEFGALNVVKSGVNMLTKVLFQELQGSQIRVNSIIPAPTATDFLTSAFTETEIANMKQNGKLGTTSEFVDQVNGVIQNETINGEFVISERLK